MITLNQIIIAIAILFATFLLANIVSWIMKKLEKFTNATESNLDDEIIESLRTPAKLIIMLGGVYATNLYLNINFNFKGITVDSIFKILLILTITYVSVKLLNTIIMWYSVKISPKTKTDLDDHIVPFIQTFAKIGVYVFASLMVLDALGIKIGPLLAGLGIAGLAVAMALQDTLSNFFASIHIAVDRPVKKGDFIQLENGDQGEVGEVGWRSTKIKLLSNNTIIIPNAKLSQSTITNFNSPEKILSVKISCGISYNSNLEVVEKTAISVGNKIMKKHGVKNQVSVIRFYEFGDSSINFKVFLKAKKYVDQFAMKHEFIKALHQEFNKQKIEIPFPQMDVNLKK